MGLIWTNTVSGLDQLNESAQDRLYAIQIHKFLSVIPRPLTILQVWWRLKTVVRSDGRREERLKNQTGAGVISRISYCANRRSARWKEQSRDHRIDVEVFVDIQGSTVQIGYVTQLTAVQGETTPIPLKKWRREDI